MIKVIASDMDGTLLGLDHKVAPRTLEAIHMAQEQGIRFMIATGRNFRSAMEELEELDLECDYLVGSGAEVRNPQREVVLQTPIPIEVCEELYRQLIKFPVSIIFSTDDFDYRIGTEEEIEESIVEQIHLFHLDLEPEKIRHSELYERICKATRRISDFAELKEGKAPIYKVFIFTEDIPLLKRIQSVLGENNKVAVASSFITNLEITDVHAQKGPMLKRYIESLGYTMDEVMVFGDSMNDYSMLSMDFKATVAMENAEPEIKEVAKYVTKSNEAYGVAYAIEELLKHYKETKEGVSFEDSPSFLSSCICRKTSKSDSFKRRLDSRDSPSGVVTLISMIVSLQSALFETASKKEGNFGWFCLSVANMLFTCMNFIGFIINSHSPFIL